MANRPSGSAVTFTLAPGKAASTASLTASADPLRLEHRLGPDSLTLDLGVQRECRVGWGGQAHRDTVAKVISGETKFQPDNCLALGPLDWDPSRPHITRELNNAVAMLDRWSHRIREVIQKHIGG